MLVDAAGSAELPRHFFAPLSEEAQRRFNPLLGPLFGQRQLPLLRRDHRKIVVIDDDIAFAGGMNVSEDYAGRSLGNGRFRDTHAQIRGPAALHLAKVFAESWKVSGGGSLLDAHPALGAVPRRGTRSPKRSTAPHGVHVQVLRAGARRRQRAIQRALQQTISRALRRCFLTSPYFIPPRWLVGALRAAARRGVDVRVLTAGHSDVPAAHWASQHIYGRLLSAGVRIFELDARVLHAKTATIDGIYATVGSYNLDNWSHRRLLEVNLAFLDADVAADIEASFHRDLDGAHEVTLASWKTRTLGQRLLHWLAYRLARL